MANNTIWYTRCPVPTAFGIALRLGTLAAEFAPDGIRIASIAQSPESARRESHFTHTHADSFRHGGNIPAIWARSEGAETSLIGLSWSDTPHPILALPQSGIHTVKDLRGKRLALSKRPDGVVDFWRASALRAYEVALATEGLSLSDVELIDIPVSRTYVEETGDGTGFAGALWNAATLRGLQREEVFALIQGRVDAIYSQSSFGTEAAAWTGARVVYDVGKHPVRLLRSNNALPEALTVSTGLLRSRPDLVARVVARVLQAAQWAKTRPVETVRFIAAEQGVAEEIVEIAYGPGLSQQLDVSLFEELVAAIHLRKNFLLEHGFIRNDFDIEGWIDRRPLEDAVLISTASGNGGIRPEARPA